MTQASTPARRRLRVRGQVQGVGFRPFVYRIATELGLGGWVRNDGEGVITEVEGPPAVLDAFASRLSAGAPRLARITAIESQDIACRGDGPFAIVASDQGGHGAHVTPDSATCPDCLAEMFDLANRRWRYAFTNCTNCGPRYTITGALPYDRPNTTMATFAMCGRCAAEYHAPLDRRFHAQPNACADCGPRLAAHDADGAPVACEDPVAWALAALRRGLILAIKGLGGFHLVCLADDAGAVQRLRLRKQREEKPFALMVANPASAWRHGEVDALAAAALESPQRPIVLLPRHDLGADAPAGVAPGLSRLGVMLPYAPLHFLLFHEAAGRPAGTAWLQEPQQLALVCTSANPGGEPLVTGNDEALARLAGIADAFLMHDRDILVRCDDSVVQARGRVRFMRRARGYTPQAIRLARAGPPVLALGGYLKNTFCVTRGDEAFVSQHIGDLDNRATCLALEESVRHLLGVLDVSPARVVSDLHPDFHSTRFAAQLAQELGIPQLAVQHHHAHVAAVMAEHRIDEPVLGLALDGVGLGDDGAAWGGELLRVDAGGFRRLGHLAPLPLPGGDRAAREPWRMAAAALHQLGRADEIERRWPGPAAAAVRMLLDRGLQCPPTSSAGRLFDAAAGLLGIRPVAAFEGQAAMLLEGLAARQGHVDPLRDGHLVVNGNLSMAALLAHLADCADGQLGAALFHYTLAEGLAQWAAAEAGRQRIDRIVLSGGCCMNRILSEQVSMRLEAAGLKVFEAAELPPNDGGISAGQAWVALLADGRD